MKALLIFNLLFLFSFLNAQDKMYNTHYNNLIVVNGTEFVIASITNYGKSYSLQSEHLLFINTKNGEGIKTDFPKDAQIDQVQQIKLDSLGINIILVEARTVNTNGDKGIGWGDPQQLFIYSVDGKNKIQLTQSSFFTRTWKVNNVTGAIVITGHYDTNASGEFDRGDKSEILIFDLKTGKMINKL